MTRRNACLSGSGGLIVWWGTRELLAHDPGAQVHALVADRDLRGGAADQGSDLVARLAAKGAPQRLDPGRHRLKRALEAVTFAHLRDASAGMVRS